MWDNKSTVLPSTLFQSDKKFPLHVVAIVNKIRILMSSKLKSSVQYKFNLPQINEISCIIFSNFLNL